MYDEYINKDLKLQLLKIQGHLSRSVSLDLMSICASINKGMHYGDCKINSKLILLDNNKRLIVETYIFDLYNLINNINSELLDILSNPNSMFANELEYIRRFDCESIIERLQIANPTESGKLINKIISNKINFIKSNIQFNSYHIVEGLCYVD